MKKNIIYIIEIVNFLIILVLAINSFNYRSQLKEYESKEKKCIKKQNYICEEIFDEENYIFTSRIEFESDLEGIMTNASNKSIYKYKNEEAYNKSKLGEQDEINFEISFDDDWMQYTRIAKNPNIISENKIHNWAYVYKIFLEEQGYTCTKK